MSETDTATAEETVTARPKRKNELAGAGAAVQALGIVVFLLSFLLGPIGAVFGFIGMVILLLIGSRMSLRWICSNCRNRIDSKKVTVCPACHARLQR